MTVKTRLVVSVLWTVLVMGGGLGLSYYAFTHPVPGMSAEKRAEKLGQSAGILTGIGYAVIWLPMAFARGQARRKRRR